MLLSMATTKPVLFLRIAPDLRAALEDGATEQGISLTAYCERLLKLGHEYLITSQETYES